MTVFEASMPYYNPTPTPPSLARGNCSNATEEAKWLDPRRRSQFSDAFVKHGIWEDNSMAADARRKSRVEVRRRRDHQNWERINRKFHTESNRLHTLQKALAAKQVRMAEVAAQKFAAVTIQSAWRGMRARIVALNVKKYYYAMLIHYRLAYLIYRAKRRAAAKTIQRYWKNSRKDKFRHKVLVHIRAAKSIQRAYRRHEGLKKMMLRAAIVKETFTSVKQIMIYGVTRAVRVLIRPIYARRVIENYLSSYIRQRRWLKLMSKKLIKGWFTKVDAIPNSEIQRKLAGHVTSPYRLKGRIKATDKSEKKIVKPLEPYHPPSQLHVLIDTLQVVRTFEQNIMSDKAQQNAKMRFILTGDANGGGNSGGFTSFFMLIKRNQAFLTMLEDETSLAKYLGVFDYVQRRADARKREAELHQLKLVERSHTICQDSDNTFPLQSFKVTGFKDLEALAVVSTPKGMKESPYLLSPKLQAPIKPSEQTGIVNAPQALGNSLGIQRAVTADPKLKPTPPNGPKRTAPRRNTIVISPGKSILKRAGDSSSKRNDIVLAPLRN